MEDETITPNVGLKNTIAAGTFLMFLFVVGASYKMATGTPASTPVTTAPVVQSTTPQPSQTNEQQDSELLSYRDFKAEGLLQDLANSNDLLLGDTLCRRRNHFLDQATKEFEQSGRPVLDSLNSTLAYIVEKGRERTQKRGRFDGTPEAQSEARAIILDLMAIESAMRANILGDAPRCNGISPGLVWSDGGRLNTYINESQERIARQSIQRGQP